MLFDAEVWVFCHENQEKDGFGSGCESGFLCTTHLCLFLSALTDTGVKNYAPELRRPKAEYKVSSLCLFYTKISELPTLLVSWEMISCCFRQKRAMQGTGQGAAKCTLAVI